MAATQEERATLAHLRAPGTIRDRCHNILDAGRAGKLTHFAMNDDAMASAARLVVEVIRDNYPDLAIPFHSRWRHFCVQGKDLAAPLVAQWKRSDPKECGRRMIDLAVTSVLLDAGAGAQWAFKPQEGPAIGRSEGLALASFAMFNDGAFSKDADDPHRVDAARLQAIGQADVAKAFQVSDENPLVGLAGRTQLLRSLGLALQEHQDIFTRGQNCRPGHILDTLTDGGATSIRTTEILDLILRGLSDIWPGRTRLAGANLGDVWPHPFAGGEGPSAGLVPLHKLSQWLTYSLLEPLETAGVKVVGLEAMTGLAEYRNGGLFVDTGVLVPKDPGNAKRAHKPGEEFIVEWRALTLALLDEIAPLVRHALGLSEQDFPLVKILEGGTWAAGRRIAKSLRPDSSPPFAIDSDGTVF